MATRSYWLDLFTVKTWVEFLNAGGAVTGFRDSRWPYVRKIAVGDVMLCYLTGASRFVGILEVTGDPYRDPTRDIWSDEDFPCRIPVRVVAQLTPETGVPILSLKDELSIFQNMKNPNAWTGALRASPARWSPENGEAITQAVQQAVANPVSRPIDPRKVEYRPKAIQRNQRGQVPTSDSGKVVALDPEHEPEQAADEAKPREERAHTEIQWRLLHFGSAMNLDVWVARNDRSAVYRGERLGDIPRMRSDLPRQFEDRTTRLIELIDVLWLRGDSIVAAFEIESTTSIYSGLLRMSDLVALQPNINIPLFLVAPDERRDKVSYEINRPTFNRLHPPLRKGCKFLPFSVVRNRLPDDEAMVRYLNPQFLDAIAESLADE